MWAAAHRQVLSSVVFKTVYFKQFSYFNSRFRQVVFYIVFLYLQKAASKLLLENHADPNKEGLGGETPLLFAASQGQSGIIDKLLHHGADINHADMVIRYLSRKSVHLKTKKMN